MSTVDQYTLKFTSEGIDDLNEGANALNQIQKNTKDTSDQAKAFNIRNVAYQIQDLSVQIAGGTSAFVALGQQLPQLLGSFGTAGAVIGAVAAVAIPLLRVGLEAIGVDFRSLDQRLKDATAATADFQAAQRANASSVVYLSNTFGNLAPIAKEFYNIQEQLSKQKAFYEIGASVSELKDKLGILSPAARETSDSFLGMVANVTGINALRASFKEMQLGLTASQAKELGDRINALDPNNMEKLAKQSTDLLKYLHETLPPTDKFRQQMEIVLGPVSQIAQAALDTKKNIEAAAIASSALNTSLLNIQTSFLPKIGDAKRSFDQIKAIQLESQAAIAIETKRLNAQTAQDGVSRAKELAAFTAKTNEDAKQKILDVKKAQDETALAAGLALDAKTRQLAVEDSILKLNQDGKLAALDAYQYNSDNLRVQAEYVIELKAIDEQLRKNAITAEQAEGLRAKALANRTAGERNADDALQARQTSYLAGLERANELDQRKIELTQKTATVSDREKKNAEQIFALETDRLTQLKGIAALPPDQQAQRADEINAAFERRVAITKQQQDADRAVQTNFSDGWTRAYANYVDSSKNAADVSAQLFKTFTDGLTDSFVNFAKTGKLSFGDMISSILEQLLRSGIKNVIADLFSGIGGGGGGQGLFGTIISGIGSLLGFADGGTIPTNRPVMVGERGPEIISGAKGMTVIPNSGLGGGIVNYYINAVDAPSFKSLIARDPQFLHAVVQQGAKSTVSRG